MAILEAGLSKAHKTRIFLITLQTIRIPPPESVEVPGVRAIGIQNEKFKSSISTHFTVSGLHHYEENLDFFL